MSSDVDRLLDRAETSLGSARLLLNSGDPNSAVSRAYYAVFDAARAVLSTRGTESPFSIKTHHGLWAHFSKTVVQDNLMPREVAKVVPSIEKLRLAADYLAEPLPPDVADRAVREAQRFVAACRNLIAGSSSP